jgi:hypothetical protein
MSPRHLNIFILQHIRTLWKCSAFTLIATESVIVALSITLLHSHFYHYSTFILNLKATLTLLLSLSLSYFRCHYHRYSTLSLSNCNRHSATPLTLLFLQPQIFHSHFLSLTRSAIGKYINVSLPTTPLNSTDRTEHNGKCTDESCCYTNVSHVTARNYNGRKISASFVGRYK